MKLNSFTVEGFKNLPQPVTFGPLQAINVLHGANNAGKSNLLQAMDVLFRLLGTGNQVSKSQVVGLENGEKLIGCSFTELFHLETPTPIRWRVELSIDAAELEEMSIEPELPTDAVTLVADLTPGLAGAAQFRIEQFLLGERDGASPVDVAKLDPEKDIGVAFAQTLRGVIAGTFALDDSRRGSPFARLDLRCPGGGEAGGGRVPQAIREALFDARQAVDRELRRRWSLFSQLAAALEPELGPGQFETAFDRQTGRADLVFDNGEVAYPIGWLGSGIQQLVALLGSLALTRARYVALEEPELHLAHSLQGRLPGLLATVLASGCGPQQFFVASQSRALDAGDNSFVMERAEAAPELVQRAWEEGPVGDGVVTARSGADGEQGVRRGDGGAPPAKPAVKQNPSSRPVAERSEGGDLDSLIGLVDQLSELEPQEIVPQAAGAGAPKAAPTSGGKPPDPAWKWQPKQNRGGRG
jgi:AAA domain, putative AbiEii toxin, Type IV TA system